MYHVRNETFSLLLLLLLLQVYGVLTWRGVREEKPRLINGRAKRVWRWMPSQEQQQQYVPMVRDLQRQQDLQRLAAQKAEAAAGKEAGS
jgi:hypothetical protein